MPGLRALERERLFSVDILARLTGMNAGQYTLKVAGRDDYGIDVLAVEQFVIVLIDGPVGVLFSFEGLGPRKIAIAQRDNLGGLGQLLEQELARPPTPMAPTVIRSLAPGRPAPPQACREMNSGEPIAPAASVVAAVPKNWRRLPRRVGCC